MARRKSGLDNRRMRGCVRDVLALTGMPAWWIGRSPSVIAESTHEMLTAMLGQASIHVELRDVDAGRNHSAGPGIPFAEQGLRTETLAIGVDGEFGRLVVGSARPDFPDEIDAILLRVAANEIAVSFRYATLLQRHQEAEQRLARLADEQAQARAEAERASNLKTQFLGIMSHELRTPLNAIGGYVQLLDEEIRGPLTQAQRDDLRRIRRAQQHLLSVISNNLGFLRLNSGKLPYNIRNVAVDDLLGAVEDLTRPLLEAKHLRYQRHCPEHGLLVRADEEKLQQVLVNLLGNATKFTDSGGAVALEVASDHSTVRFGVRDSGCGIPADRLAAVFEPFTQVDMERSVGGGTGLGLTISRDFTVGMGGRLRAESEPGHGSLFTVELPQVAAPSVQL